MSEGFLTDWHTAELFFRVVRRYKIPSEAAELRVWLMRQLVKRKKATYIRDVEEHIAGKKVIEIKPRKEDK